MPNFHYLWRSLTPEQRLNAFHERLTRALPWHSPPHRPNFATNQFHITAACFEHAPHIGHSPERMDDFSQSLISTCTPHVKWLFAWCVLPNHYHLLLETPDVLALLAALGQHHGRTSYLWNGQENTRGRQVFYRAVEREMRSDRHYYATLNYVHHNPVHHRYVSRWDQWPWSSAAEFLKSAGRIETERLWRSYPLKDYGTGWDDPEL
jgi:putative transposase